MSRIRVQAYFKPAAAAKLEAVCQRMVAAHPAFCMGKLTLDGLQERVRVALCVFMNHRFERERRGGMTATGKRKVKQLRGHLAKTVELAGDPNVQTALKEQIVLRMEQGRTSGDLSTLGDLIFLSELSDYINQLDDLLANWPKDDLRKTSDAHDLVLQLAGIFTDATGDDVKLPTVDNYNGTSDSAFMRFVAVVVADVLPELKGEALRHHIRDAIEFGEIAPKIVGPRLYTAPANAATWSATETNEVGHEPDQTDDRHP